MTVDLDTKLSVISSANSPSGIPTDYSLKEIIANSTHGGDATKFLDGTGSLSTPAGGDSSGLVLIDSGTITVPVAFFDVTLPSGYDHFVLRMSSFTLNVSVDNVSAALSSDGGDTFYCDPVNYDTYGVSYLAQQSPAPTTARGQYSAGDDSLIDWRMASDAVFDNTSIIWPGDATTTFRMRSIYHSLSADILNMAIYDWLSFFNIGATNPPTLARANLIRILPYGNGDCDPPTSGHTITAGTYYLWGQRTP